MAAAGAAGADKSPVAAAARRLRGAGSGWPLPHPRLRQPELGGGVNISSLQSELSTNATELQPAIAATLHEQGLQGSILNHL